MTVDSDRTYGLDLFDHLVDVHLLGVGRKAETESR